MSTINKRKKHFIPNFEARSVLLITAMALGGASAAHAQPVAPDVPSAPRISAKAVDTAFVRADVNKDGKLDKKETGLMPAIAARFEQLDSNADGHMSREEFGKAAGS